MAQLLCSTGVDIGNDPFTGKTPCPPALLIKKIADDARTCHRERWIPLSRGCRQGNAGRLPIDRAPTSPILHTHAHHAHNTGPAFISLMNTPPPLTPARGLLQVFLDSRDALQRYLVLRGANVDEAEDILQDIALKLATQPLGPVDQPRAYLYRMATNHFLLHRRAAQRRTHREEDWVDASSGDSRDVDPTPSADAGLLAQQQLALVQRLIDRLPERTRTIFRRFRLSGEAQRQIAADIGISTSAVEKHLARAYAEISEIRILLDADTPGPRHLKDAKDRHDR